MATLDASLTVNEILRRWPATAVVLNSYGVDLCCGGALPLIGAAASVGADLDSLLRDLCEAAALPPEVGPR